MQTLSVYIHWPFCASKCPYCDFNSHVRSNVDYAAWQRALLSELDLYLQLTGRRKIETVFFGGGTPSLMPPGIVAALLEQLAANGLEAGAEVTLEANPNSVEISRLREFKNAGINRVSLGIQSLEEKHLRFLGRRHNAMEARKAIEAAAATFSRYSFDLIFGLPAQTPANWEAELAAALPLAGSHLSLYQLTIEPGTNFHHLHKAGKLELAVEDTLAEFYDITISKAAAHGLARYEVSNFAVPGHECRHNLRYWRYEDYIGIGPGAHGRFKKEGESFKTMSQNTRSPEAWLLAQMSAGQ